MRRPKIAVFSYGAGNVYSASQALGRVGAQVTVTDRTAALSAADGVLVPGVGAFGYVMSQFRGRGGTTWLKEAMSATQPILGVCVGMQLLFDGSTEMGESKGLGVLSGTIAKLPALPLPHVGWQKLTHTGSGKLLDGLSEQYFYFVHSYGRLLEKPDGTLVPVKNQILTGTPVTTTEATYGTRFAAAVESGNLCGTQFHPEKSGEAGLQLLENWLEITTR